MNTSRKILAMVVVLFAIVVLSASIVLAADPSPQSVSDIEVDRLSAGERGYIGAFRFTGIAPPLGVADVYVSVAVTGTQSADVITVTLQHSPDGAGSWVNTDLTNGQFEFVHNAGVESAASFIRVPVYGQAIAANVTVSGTVRYTPTIIVVYKDNAGQ